MNTLVIRSADTRPANLEAMTIGELVTVALAGEDLDVSAIGEAVARVTLEDLDVLDCASTPDDVQLAQHVEDAARHRIQARGRAFVELARRIREANA